MIITEKQIIEKISRPKGASIYHPKYFIGLPINTPYGVKTLSETGQLIAMVENNKVKRIVPASFVYNMKFKAVIEGVLSSRFYYAKKREILND